MLFQSAEIKLRLVGEPEGALAIVTFSSFADLPDLDREGFAEGFLRGRAIPAIHIVARTNRWYQHEELPAALEAAREAAAGYATVLAYGSSMGGYAALRFGSRAGATVALAISPQHSIDPARAPFDPRWRAQARAIRFLHEDLPARPPLERAYVVFDPRDLDRRHVELIARDHPVVPIRLPGAGHPAGAFLAETGLLPDMVLEIGRGTFDALALEAEARRRRRRSGLYLSGLARRLPLARLPLKLELARMAADATPGEPLYRSLEARLLEAAGRPEAAANAHRRAVAVWRGNPFVLASAGRFLVRAGRWRRGLALLRAAYRLAPAQPGIGHGWTVAALARGRYREAAALATRILRRRPAAAGPLAADMLRLLVRQIASGRAVRTAALPDLHLGQTRLSGLVERPVRPGPG